ncbi:MAG TPA: HAD-IB family hydrolase [Steroidobacteraceae bacterium]|nr:HAD-IB family hydrolase [Steroidobacteraceae bacterium]
MRIALFDLDGTLTRRDSLFPYVLGFCLRHPLRLPRLLAMPWQALRYLFVHRDRGVLKEALIVAGLRGVSREQVARWNQRFVRRLVERGMYPEALERLALHRARGDYLVLMSASPDLYVPAVARALKFNETICTGVRWNGMTLSGELTTPNRRAEEKLLGVEALRARYDGSQITGYGNSASDVVHLRACDAGHLVNASPRAAVEAARAGVAVGWPFESVAPPSR